MVKRSLVNVITEARPGHTVDVNARERRYLITMAIRTAAFIGMVFMPPVWGGSLLVLALVLPWIAVMLANNQDIRAPELQHSPEPDGSRPALTSSEVLKGEVVDEDVRG